MEIQDNEQHENKVRAGANISASGLVFFKATYSLLSTVYTGMVLQKGREGKAGGRGNKRGCRKGCITDSFITIFFNVPFRVYVSIF